MATFTSTTAPISSSSSSSFLRSSSIHHQNHQFSLLHNHNHTTKTFHKKKQTSLTVQAVKLPAGVELPKVQPKFEPPFLGFTRTAETWNSRACMIGLIGTFIVELIINKGILQVIGVDIGKGLDLPL